MKLFNSNLIWSTIKTSASFGCALAYSTYWSWYASVPLAVSASSIPTFTFFRPMPKRNEYDSSVKGYKSNLYTLLHIWNLIFLSGSLPFLPQSIEIKCIAPGVREMQVQILGLPLRLLTWASYLASLSISFLICKMGVKTLYFKWDNVGKDVATCQMRSKPW